MITTLHLLLIASIVCGVGTGVLFTLFLLGFIPALRKWWQGRKAETSEQGRPAVIIDGYKFSCMQSELSAARERIADLEVFGRASFKKWNEVRADLELTKEVAAEAIAERDKIIAELQEELRNEFAWSNHYSDMAHHHQHTLVDAEETIALLQDALSHYDTEAPQSEDK